jgi:hypothetical protein
MAGPGTGAVYLKLVTTSDTYKQIYDADCGFERGTFVGNDFG